MLNVNSMLLDDDPGPILEKPRWARQAGEIRNLKSEILYYSL